MWAVGNFHFEDSEIISELSSGGGGVGEKQFAQGGSQWIDQEAGYFFLRPWIGVYICGYVGCASLWGRHRMMKTATRIQDELKAYSQKFGV